MRFVAALRELGAQMACASGRPSSEPISATSQLAAPSTGLTTQGYPIGDSEKQSRNTPTHASAIRMRPKSSGVASSSTGGCARPMIASERTATIAQVAEPAGPATRRTY
jgi:hypothetical protein